MTAPAQADAAFGPRLRLAPAGEPRHARLGASEVASVLDLGGFHTPVEVWEIKTGRKSHGADTPSTRYGRRQERVVIEWAADELGCAFLPGAAFDAPFVVGDSPVIGAHPDAYFNLGVWVPGECKALNDPDAVGAGADDIAPNYWTQVQIQLYCTGAPFAIFAAQVPTRAGKRVTQSLEIRRIAADPTAQARMVELSEEWWYRHVVGDVQPEPVDEEERARLLAYAFPRNVAPLRPATDAEAEAVRRLHLAKLAARAADAEVEIAANAVRALIGDAEGLSLPTGKATWKAQEATRLDITALRAAHPDIAAAFSVTSTSRVLRVNLKE